MEDRTRSRPPRLVIGLLSQCWPCSEPSPKSYSFNFSIPPMPFRDVCHKDTDWKRICRKAPSFNGYCTHSIFHFLPNTFVTSHWSSFIPKNLNIINWTPFGSLFSGSSAHSCSDVFTTLRQTRNTAPLFQLAFFRHLGRQGVLDTSFAKVSQKLIVIQPRSKLFEILG